MLLPQRASRNPVSAVEVPVVRGTHPTRLLVARRHATSGVTGGEEGVSGTGGNRPLAGRSPGWYGAVMNPAQLFGVALLVVTAQLAVGLLSFSGLVHPIAPWRSSLQPPQYVTSPFPNNARLQERRTAPAGQAARPRTAGPDAIIAAVSHIPTLRVVARLAATPTCLSKLPTPRCCGARAPPPDCPR